MALIGDLLANAALFQPYDHSIGNFFPDVAIREVHRDAMIVTQHPVEGGGVVSDHVFRRPAELELEYGFSNATAGTAGYVQQQYAAVLRMKDARQLQRIFTTKRAYKNMVVSDVATATDDKTGESTVILIRCVELIVVSTQTTGTGTDTTQPGQTTSNPDGSVQTAQANPQSTGSVTERGNVQTQDVGPQAFAGSFNPGVIAQSGGLGLGGAVGEALSGLSPPTATAEVGELTVEGPDGEPLPEATVPASPGYNPFAVGAFGGT